MNRLKGSKILLAQQDLFTGSDEQSYSLFLKAIGHAVCFIALLVFGYVCFSAFKYAYYPTDLDSIKLVRREIAPVRVLPDNPGGEQFQNQDKFIYNSLAEKKQRAGASKEQALKDEKQGDSVSVKKAKLEGKKSASDDIVEKSVDKKTLDVKQKEVPSNIKAPSPDEANLTKAVKMQYPAKEAKPSSKKVDSVFDVLE